MMLTQENVTERRVVPIGLPRRPITVETRFGVYDFTAENTILMPLGLIGFTAHRVFGLANLPAPIPEDFKLLQSLAEPPISFIVMPFAGPDAPISAKDLEANCAANGFDPAEVHCLYLCTIARKRKGTGIEISANLRAPVLLNLATRQARQCVLADNRYPLRQRQDKWDGAL